MSKYAAKSSLEDLEIKSHLITKLKNAGVESVFDLAIAVLHQLLQGADERVALDLVMRARRALADSGALVKDFSTAEDLLERRNNLLKCTTGSSRFDSFLKGGVETQAMTEIAGEYGSGKTQLCYILCVTANLPLNNGGFNGSVMFIDTENTFRPERIHQIAENRGIVAPEKILQKIYVCKVYNAGHIELVIQNLGKSIPKNRLPFA